MGQSGKEIAKILIIDDVDTNRFVLRDIITEMGYQPILAENGSQALKIVERLLPQLIISDVAMPEMDGFEFCEHMKANPRTREIPIIFISAFDNTEDVVKGFKIGGEDYITKPFVPDIVKARVGLHLKLFEASKSLVETNRLLQTSINEQLRQIEIEKKNVLYALTRVARENAAYDTNHMERLSYNAQMLAEAMQLTPEYGTVISDTFIETIGLATPLSDIGNVAIPTHILQKEETLMPDEVECIRTHTTIGAKIIQDIQTTGDYNDFLQMSHDIALSHHEHWDGTGYPEGKSGEEIPLAAQIVAVAGNFCSITEHRVYREAYTKEEAIEMMEKNAGIIYNPRIFSVMKMIARQLH